MTTKKPAKQTEYVPGVCNINTAEIAYRKNAEYFGLAISLVLFVLLFAFDINRYVRIVLFIPLFIAAINYLQTKNKFCVMYGAAGKQNATEGSTAAEVVTNNKAAAKDKIKARSMNLQAMVIAAGLTALTLLV